MNSVNSKWADRMVSSLVEGPLPPVDPTVIFNPWGDAGVPEDATVGTSGAFRREALRSHLSLTSPPKILVMGRCNGPWGTHLSGVPLFDARVLSLHGHSRVLAKEINDSAPANAASAWLWLSLSQSFKMSEVMTWSVMPYVFRKPGKEGAMRARTIPVSAPAEHLPLGKNLTLEVLDQFPDTPLLVLGNDAGDLIKQWAPERPFLIDPDFDYVGHFAESALFGEKSVFIKSLRQIASGDFQPRPPSREPSPG